MSQTKPSTHFPNDNDWITEADLSETAQAKPDFSLAAPPSPLSSASWAPDALSPDYQHLGIPLNSDTFDFTAWENRTRRKASHCGLLDESRFVPPFV